MKKILFIVNSLGKGGGERVVANLANEMAKNNRVDIISLYDDKFYELDNNISLYNLKLNKSKIKKILSFKESRKKIERKVKELEADKKYDLITIHLPISHILCNKTYFINRSYLVIHTVYSKKINIHLGKNILKHIYDDKNIITVSQGVKDELIELFKIKPRSIRNIYNPIDLDVIKQKSCENINYEKKYILFVGRLNKIKKCDLLIKSFKKTNIQKEYSLVIVGDGEEKEKLINLSSNLKLYNKVEFLGWQDNPYRWMKNSELLVVCSEYESFAMNIIEALACNTKVISVDCNYGPREILNGELSDFLIKSYDEENIAKAIDNAVLSYPQNRNRYVKDYDISYIVNKYLEVCDDFK